MEPPQAGAAHQLKDGDPSRPDQGRKQEAFDASAYRSGVLPPNPAYEEFQREYAARYAPYSEPAVSRRRRGFRAVHMAMIFTLGAAAGLAGAWWADTSGHHPAPPPVPGIVSAKPALPPYEQLIRRDKYDGAQGGRGIRSSELPYDGRSPEDGEVAAASLPAAPLSSAAISSGGGGDEEGATSSQRAASATAASASESAGKSSSTESASAGRIAGSGAGRVKDTESKAPDATTSSKRTTVAKNTKDKEIERIRRQADEELRKKNAASRRADDGRNASQVAQKSQIGARSASALTSSNSYKALLARCDAVSNIFRREQCKWKLCNGMWGKNGCPSYAKPNNLYNY